MPKVAMEDKLAIPLEEVWKLIGGFNALPDWHPAVAKSTLEDGGRVRKLDLVGGGSITERLESFDENEKTYSYSIVAGPLPVANYKATLKVRKDPNCALCGENPTITGLIDYEDFCGTVSREAQDAATGSTISVTELRDWLASEKPVHLVDVREPAEWEIVRIPGAVLIPKGDILSGDALSELPQDRQIVLYCKTGVRSAEALAAVKAAGFADAVHVVIHLGMTPDGIRVVSSVREVIDSDGEHIVSNEVYRPGPDRRAVPATQLRGETLERLIAVGFDPAQLDADRW